MEINKTLLLLGLLFYPFLSLKLSMTASVVYKRTCISTNNERFAF